MSDQEPLVTAVSASARENRRWRGPAGNTDELTMAAALGAFGPVPDRVVVSGAGRGHFVISPGEVLWALERSTRISTVAEGCWLFEGYTRNGYGSLSIRNSLVYLHRLSFAISSGGAEAPEDVCHTCDVRRCWSPGHLFAGSRMENVRDAWAKGRATKPPRIAGERHPKAVLSDEDVAAIRASTRPQRELAAAFDCSQSTIWRLRHGVVRS